MKENRISRRTVLKGLGGVTIGLPLLEEMIGGYAVGAENSVPVRAFNIFFGLGIPVPLQEEEFDGVLEPLTPLRDKLLVMRHLDQIRCDVDGINAHFDGATGAFTAMPAGGEAKAGGPSLDQVVRYTHYPRGLPAGIVSTLIGGTYFRRSRVGRYLHSYNLDGTVAGTMQEKPRDLFDRVFGSVTISGDGKAHQLRLRRSVLDSVVDQFRFYTGVNSPLGIISRSRVAEHLDRIREYEQRAFEMKGKHAEGPRLPARSEVPHGGQADPGGQGIDITLEELTTEWRLMADLYALAIEMDRVRFGSITFLAAGERIRLTGNYNYQGRKIFEFDDGRQHDASGEKGCSHEWWHKFDEKKENVALRAHAHLKMREVAYFLNLLDQQKEVNGRSILENAMITISTESGDGRHNNSKRELTGVFHAITAANGRFKSGKIIDVRAEAIDIYNTMISAMGGTKRLGPAEREYQHVSSILV